MVVDQYIHGLNNHELKKHVQFHHPQTLSQAIAFASEYEAFLGPVDKIVKPRETFDAHNIQTLQALTESEQQNSESKILGQISQMIDNKFKEYLNENRTVDTSRNRIGSYNEPNKNEGQGFYNRSSQSQNRFDRPRDITCYYCHELGHIRTRCPYLNRERERNYFDSNQGPRNSLNEEGLKSGM
ncbi:unnamed protein product [Mytilus coruscus]|uniref:CCHC-type domain-containing protein n=1 Tax=Mytilus coruscus TaxID=42192 RepID=A0A6J8C117_MYTCO|nr:unnamed protein product [Mytilus coruscus]